MKQGDNIIEKEPLIDPLKENSINTEESIIKASEIAPKETGSTYLMCLLFGIASVLPFNVVVAAMDIFQTKLSEY